MQLFRGFNLRLIDLIFQSDSVAGRYVIIENDRVNYASTHRKCCQNGIYDSPADAGLSVLDVFIELSEIFLFNFETIVHTKHWDYKGLIREITELF